MLNMAMNIENELQRLLTSILGLEETSSTIGLVSSLAVDCRLVFLSVSTAIISTAMDFTSGNLP